MLDRSPSPENQTLTNQVAQFLNIHEDRIKIDEHGRALIHCATDDEMYDMQEQWASMTMHFHDRIKYLVLHKDDYQRSLFLSENGHRNFPVMPSLNCFVMSIALISASALL